MDPLPAAAVVKQCGTMRVPLGTKCFGTVLVVSISSGLKASMNSLETQLTAK